MKKNGLLTPLLTPLLTAAWFCMPCQVSAQIWPGPNFREFSGVCQSGADNALFQSEISWNRREVEWRALEPSRGVWNQARLDAIGEEVLALQAQGVSHLPILAYMTDWAADKSARQWTVGIESWIMTPNDDGSMTEDYYRNNSLVSSRVLREFSKFPPVIVADWTNYVTRVVNFLHPAPYNVQYFNVWNEAYYRPNGFWHGSLDDYMQRIHLPAAEVIHAAGAKVVYGGWPDIGSLQELISLLDRNNAWSTIDVLDFHYLGTNAFQTLRSAADLRGYSNMAIWQTEVGFDADKPWVARSYPRRLYWALGNNWEQDKYKVFYFANWSPNDPMAYGYNRCLYSGSALSHHGQCLTNLAALLGGSNPLSRFTGVTSVPELSPQIIIESALFAFQVSNTIVLTVHLSAPDYEGFPNISFNLPLPISEILKAERVDLTGTTLDLTCQLVANGDTTQLLGVPVKDAEGTSARDWNDGTTNARTFYVRVTRTAAPRTLCSPMAGVIPPNKQQSSSGLRACLNLVNEICRRASVQRSGVPSRYPVDK